MCQTETGMAARLRIAVSAKGLRPPVCIDIASLGKALLKPVWGILHNGVDDDLEFQARTGIQNFRDLFKIVVTFTTIDQVPLGKKLNGVESQLLRDPLQFTSTHIPWWVWRPLQLLSVQKLCLHDSSPKRSYC